MYAKELFLNDLPYDLLSVHVDLYVYTYTPWVI